MSERTLPTRPGWWLVDVFYLPEPVPANVLDGLELCRLWGETELLDTNDVRLFWFAPIPSPDICIALEQYRAALAAFHGARPGQFTASDKLFDEADAALQAAVRAEFKEAN